MTQILALLLGGLTLFLLGIRQMSKVLEKLLTQRAAHIVARYTSNLFSSLLIGVLLTICLNSSSALIIVAIVFINSKVLTFRQAIGIIMGANIGTTISSQIIALDISNYAWIALAVGLLVWLISKKEKIKQTGLAVFFFGMIFFGIFLMKESVWPLQESELFAEWVSDVEDNYVWGTLIGGLITLIIQSSSGTVGIAIVLGKQGILSVAGGISIMLGAELGTCSDTLIATIRGSRQAIKAGLFHLAFNLLTIILGLLVFTPFVALVLTLSGDQDIGNQIANAHVLFNILGVLLFLPFVGIAEKSLNRLIPEKSND